MTEFVRWLTLTHSQRLHAHRHTTGYGHIYQGRFKSFPIERDESLLNVLRYVERNALRANLIERAQDWRWCSLWRRLNGDRESLLSTWPLEIPADWISWVNRAQTAIELEALRKCVNRGAPYGSEDWKTWIANLLRLEFTLRPRGRPRKALR
jgi:putative transposase